MTAFKKTLAFALFAILSAVSLQAQVSFEQLLNADREPENLVHVFGNEHEPAA